MHVLAPNFLLCSWTIRYSRLSRVSGSAARWPQFSALFFQFLQEAVCAMQERCPHSLVLWVHAATSTTTDTWPATSWTKGLALISCISTTPSTSFTHLFCFFKILQKYHGFLVEWWISWHDVLSSFDIWIELHKWQIRIMLPFNEL